MLRWIGTFVASCSGFLSAFGHGDVHQQIAALDAELAKQPKNGELMLRRAELWWSDGNWTNAIADCDRASVASPKLRLVDLVRGRIQLESGHASDATNLLTRFLSAGANTNNAIAWVTRARAYEALHERLSAADDLARAIQLLPAVGPDLVLERARLLRESGEAFWPEALRALDSAIAQQGPLVTLQLAAIDLEVEMKRYDAALARVARVTEEAPRKETWHARRAEILQVAGRHAEALSAWQDALKELEALPERLRRTKATLQLEERIRGALKLDATPSPGANP